ncbi:disulfide bond formation protein DsbB [Candidatus Kinetoplastibacterium blastocrithidii TCC012E]|uniref:Disulfide bond formation protein DsbB n=1 Tax=Candidatus Kinetoplastidibacterium blastocrithidiae TCC012E TaxID=1208922 RepID=M1LW41_9PROT|nr:disulfide bond formation protein B [Candidatus Kinetoplastibacterium blastocrithidii]AFZ83626.1 disulfide bond formation protein DsbB [Candidatus Kinetoplastibacterium blastocrithidii (ex Strigomonas culicis)]AGF49747.1 disulfide bond formation protein DsbB [Candidatus Kinetoplastibacterium blastocrithidii TCC012E]
MQTTYRNKLFILVSILCFTSISAALISQHVFDMKPCSWCIVQRLIFFIIGIVSFIGFYIRSDILSRMVAIIISILSILGILAVYMQKISYSENLSCMMITPADSIINSTGFDSLIPWLFSVYSSCADDPVFLFGVEYFIWSLSLFIILAVIAISAAIRNIN